MMRFALLWIVLAFVTGSSNTKAEPHDIQFVAVSVSGQPVAGQVLLRKGAAPPAPLVRLDTHGRMKVSDIECTTGLQFSAKPKFPIYIPPPEWLDCRYGEIKFVFNEVSWANLYQQTIDKVAALALDGPANVRLDALFTASALETNDYGKLALGAAELRKKIGASSALAKGLLLIEMDSKARALGIQNGISMTAEGQVKFNEAANEKFKSLTVENKLPFSDINDPNLNAYIAKEDYLNLKSGIMQYKLPPS